MCCVVSKKAEGKPSQVLSVKKSIVCRYVSARLRNEDFQIGAVSVRVFIHRSATCNLRTSMHSCFREYFKLRCLGFLCAPSASSVSPKVDGCHEEPDGTGSGVSLFPF